ncbi:peroxiredoxin [Hyphobacterium marinum]|uniref:thioredoxin-dependent peroxiredoxin n=1 Tax=Hyphobacterium marinum TaxID=3116574 RepID=A0ABU7LV61_9PROT|nr:redoxin domain-containing protein [Hyphobacterium sp. Y6023]MEE2565142.1 redoxin domain-containing protein [Hyphobacterium sp. Y6023]
MIRQTLTAAFALAAALAAAFAAPALAELEPGETAPDFTVDGFQAGAPVSFHLAEALETGPVVLFFFPAAFTSGCEAQAASFAESIAEFEALGAQVIGITAGNTDRLAEFSTQHCASAFPVFALGEGMMADYDVRLAIMPGRTSRTTHVINADGVITMTHNELNPYEHVDRSLAALREMAPQD